MGERFRIGRIDPGGFGWRMTTLIFCLRYFQYCRRRWALVHIEQYCEENVQTQEGHYMHERVHDSDFTEVRGAVVCPVGCQFVPRK